MAEIYQLQTVNVEVTEAVGQPQTAVIEDITKLYPDRASGTAFNTIIALLSELNRYFQSAKRTLDAGDPLEADSEVMNAWALLPELFCLRNNSSDGYASLITVLYNSIKNLNGMPLNEIQLVEISYAVRRLNAEPMISFEMAIPLIKNIRKSGLQIESASMQALSEVLSE